MGRSPMWRFSEGVPIAFSVPYFIVDLFDCIRRRDAPFFVHAAVSIGIASMSYSHPVLYGMRLSSRGYLIELSTLQLHRWKKSKTKSDFALFFAAFTVCRIVWLPWVFANVVRAIGIRHVISQACALLCFLQFVWWFKMIPMLLNYRGKISTVDGTVYGNEKEKDT